MKIQITENRFIGTGEKPYIIAEIGSNHNGNIDLAKKLIFEAKKSGSDCVKFQSFTTKSIFSEECYKTDSKLKATVSQYALSDNQFKELKDYSEKLNIDFFVTPFSKKEVDFIVDVLKVKFIKVASMDVNNYEFLEYISKKGKPIVLSTGLSNLSEIDEAIRKIEFAGNDKIIVLHCVANYPPKDGDINLNNIQMLKNLYNYPIGFSDHTIGTSIPLAAIAKGACVIEKHFTLDKKMEGWDHAISADPSDMQILTRESQRIYKALGTSRKVQVEGKEKINSFRRSLVAAQNIRKGQKFREELIDCKRPGWGLPPSAKKYLIGKVAKRDISADEIINFEDF